MIAICVLNGVTKTIVMMNGVMRTCFMRTSAMITSTGTRVRP